MNVFAQAQNLVVLVIGIAALGFALYGFIDAMRHDAQAYASEGKLSKNIWLAILGVAIALLFVAVGTLNLFGLIAIVAVGVYFADVRPALAPYRNRQRRGGAGGSGPHGSW
ncbi:MAG: DUF2516 family protein [Mobilicoccus sp.]|nr:DUF2516 family protein [Mobilicoccus sp.]